MPKTSSYRPNSFNFLGYSNSYKFGKYGWWLFPVFPFHIVLERSKELFFIKKKTGSERYDAWLQVNYFIELEIME